MKDLTVGKESRLILSFAFPIMLGFLVQQLYSVADSIIVGQFIKDGEAALAAIGAAYPVIFFLIAFVVGISNGGTIIISHYFGAKDTNGITRAIDTINIFLIFCGIIISAIGILFSESIFRLIGLPSDVIPLATEYMTIYSVGFLGMFGYHGIAAILRGMGDSHTPLYALILSSVLNVLLDLLFIVVFKWGVASVAWATVIAQTASFIAIIIYINRRHTLIKLSLKLQFDKNIFKQSVKIGLPSGIQQSLVGLGNIALFAIVSRFNTDVVAAYSVAGRIDMLCTVPIMALAGALTTFTGQNLGALQLHRVMRGYRVSILMAVAISAFLSIATIVFAEPIMRIFTTNDRIVPIGVNYLNIVSPFYAVFAVLFISNAALKGSGNTLIPMFTTLLGLWIIRVPLSHFLSLEFGESGIWWGIPGGWLFGMILASAIFYSGRWEKNKIIINNNK